MRDVGSALVSSLVIFRGRSGHYVDTMTSYDRAFTTCFYLSIVSLLFILILGLAMAVLNSAYKEVRKEMFFNAAPADDQDYQMIEFMIQRLKIYLKITEVKPVSTCSTVFTFCKIYTRLC